MAEAGSTAERVKQQADIARVVGEYVRLKKTGKDFSRLCPFHQGKLARAYLEDRGMDKATIDRFGIGYAPSGGDLLLRQLKGKYAEKLRAESGLVSREQNGSRLFDRFRRRITFPIANEGGKIVAFGCRALGDDQPKYLNSPETPIYSKSNVLYHLDRAKEALRRSDFAVLTEGYMH